MPRAYIVNPPASNQKVRKNIERLLKKNEYEIQKIYLACNAVLRLIMNKYYEKYKADDERRKKQVEAGVITKEDYLQWRLATLLFTKDWIKTRKTMTDELVRTAQKARKVTIDNLPYVYAEASNEEARSIARQCARLKGKNAKVVQKGKSLLIKQTVKTRTVSGQDKEASFYMGISFDLVDEATVKRLFTTKEEIYHIYGKQKALEIEAGLREPWEKEKVQKALLTSIIQGEDVTQIAQRLADTVTVDDMNSAIRDARSMTTAAESAGRADRYEEAENMGIIMKQEWIAAVGDNRTRPAHRKLNGQQVNVGEPFRVDGYELRYPGDTSAPGYLYYNCRCTTGAVVLGFK